LAASRRRTRSAEQHRVSYANIPVSVHASEQLVDLLDGEWVHQGARFFHPELAEALRRQMLEPELVVPPASAVSAPNLEPAGELAPDREAIVLPKGVQPAVDALGAAVPSALGGEEAVKVIGGDLLEAQPGGGEPSVRQRWVVGVRLRGVRRQPAGRQALEVPPTG
jgi:hypothetical protein